MSLFTEGALYLLITVVSRPQAKQQAAVSRPGSSRSRCYSGILTGQQR